MEKMWKIFLQFQCFNKFKKSKKENNIHGNNLYVFLIEKSTL